MDTPPYLHGLIDDAAIFPPRALPLDRALAAHLEHRETDSAPLVGDFVVTDGRLPELCDLVSESSTGTACSIDLVITGGAGAIAGAVTWAGRADGVELHCLDLALRDEADLAHNARRVVAALDDAEVDCAVFVELPALTAAPTTGWLQALDVLAERDLGVSLRLGGVEPAQVAPSAQVADCLRETLDRELRLKSVAGAARAVRDDAGHGFVNLPLATRAELDGDDPVAVLEERDGAVLTTRLDSETMLRTRRWFVSCAGADPLEAQDDLVELGLLR